MTHNTVSWYFTDLPQRSFKRDSYRTKLFETETDPILALTDSAQSTAVVYCVSHEEDRFVIEWGAYAEEVLLLHATRLANQAMNRYRELWRVQKAPEEVIHGFGKLIEYTELRRRFHAEKGVERGDLQRAHEALALMHEQWAERCQNTHYNQVQKDWSKRLGSGPVRLWRSIALVRALLDPDAPPMLLRCVIQFMLELPDKDKLTQSELSEDLIKKLNPLAKNAEHDEPKRRRDGRWELVRLGLLKENLPRLNCDDIL